MIRRIIVLGGGTAGLFAALSLKTRLPQLDVTVLRSQDIGIIGVGEGTTVGLPSFLHSYLRLDPTEFFRRVAPTWKLGLRFVNWGPRPTFHYSFAPAMQVRWNQLPKLAGYYCSESMDSVNFAAALMERDRVFLRTADGMPQMQHDFGYHLENAALVEALEAAATARGIPLLDEKVREVRRNADGISALLLESGGEETADLYIDASGFRSVLLGDALGVPFRSFESSLFCDRAVVGGWERGQEPIRSCTTVETMPSGWIWRIDHEKRINRGYVYASAFVGDDEAEHDFRQQNPSVTQTRVVQFRSGRFEHAWAANVVAIGNSCGFVEPLEATSLGTISSECAALVEVLRDTDLRPTPTQVRYFNERVAISWDNIRRFLAIHYQLNTRLETPFWRACRSDTDLAGAQPLIEFFQENGPSDTARQLLLNQLDQFTIDGWLTLLVGMNVPYRAKHSPSPSELQLWAQIRERIQGRAAEGLTVQQALNLVRSSHWKWNPHFYPQ